MLRHVRARLWATLEDFCVGRIEVWQRRARACQKRIAALAKVRS